MGKKTNAYSEFIKTEYDSRKRREPNFRLAYNQFFQDSSLSSKWSGMSEESKQVFRDIATSKNNGSYNPRHFRDALRRHESESSSGSIILTGPNDDTGSRKEDDKKPTIRHSSPTCSNQVEIRPSMHVQRQQPSRAGLPGIPNSKKMAKLRQEGKEIPMPDEMLHEHMASYRLYMRCKDIIFSKEPEELMESPLYAISCNVLCSDNGEESHYIPLEIAIYSYSIERGEAKPLYLTFINPGEPPQGKMGEAKEHAENSKHCIPFKPMYVDFVEYARTDFREVYKEMLEYVGEERIVLCQKADYLEQIHGVIKWLAKKANENCLPHERLPNIHDWKLFVIKDYVFHLGKRLHSPLPNDLCIEMLLENSKFDYVTDFNCEWHNSTTRETKWCAKLCAIKSIATISNLLEWYHDTYIAARSV